MKRRNLSVRFVISCLAYPCYTCRGFASFTFNRATPGWMAEQKIREGSTLQSTPDGQEPPKLILGDDVKKNMEGDKEFKWTQSTYVEMARARAEEYQRKKEQGLLDDDTNAKSTIDHEEAAQRNYGPEDLSKFTGFPDEGWEASLKNNDMANLLSEPGAAVGDDGEEPSLFVPDGDNDDLIVL